MAKDFTSKDAKKLINKHNNLISSLKNLSTYDADLKNDIKKAADAFVAQEILTILRSVPVEELNREKKGIRIKALIDHNYTTMADLYVSSRYNLAAIRGISEDSAYTIKRIAWEFAEKTRNEIKIKLSTDNKNKYSTNLVRAIAIYKNSMQHIQKSKLILLNNLEIIQDKIANLKPATNGILWLLTSKIKKERAIESYSFLINILNEDYGKKITEIITEISKISKMNSETAWSDFTLNTVKFYNILEETNPGLLGTDDSLYGLPEELARKVQDECFFPDGLKCTLRRYQEWGVKYILHQEKVLLGDEMGLGKTIQAIATMVSLKNTGATHFIVICPASVVTNWCREITKHSLLKVTKIHGNSKIEALKSWLQIGGVAVTTYETINLFDLSSTFRFALLVVDEAHYIKNPEAKRTLNTVELSKHADRLLFMTGTALENRVEEMIFLISILQPNIASQVLGLAFMSAAPQFRDKVAPVYYRRKREDVLTELPELIESKEWCEMSNEEEKDYEEAILNKHYTDARRVSWNIDDLNYSTKANRLMEIVEEAELENRKIIVFSFFLDTIRKISSFLGKRCLNPINGSISPQRRQEIIDEFDKSPSGTVLVAQIQSGGTGLNIQSASVVVICEPQFKPSIENQAISRAYRMGQSRNVLVYRLLCENTIDEKITELLEQKQAIFDAFADKSVSAQTSLEIDGKSFGDIISDEISRINAKRGIQPNTNHSNHKDYYNSLMHLSYYQLVDSLLSKYGKAQYDYFVNENCSTVNKKVSRSKEGLFCHHIDEDKAIQLSDREFAKNNPFEYQRADRLVYCNYLEHLLLHIKIIEEPRNINANEDEIPGIGGAVNFIIRQLNDLYNGYIFTKENLVIATSIVENDYESYIIMLKRLWFIIKNNQKYSQMYDKEDLSCGWNNNIIDKIYNELN